MDLTWLPLVEHSPAESPWWFKPVFFAIWVCLTPFSVARHFFGGYSFHALFPVLCFLPPPTFQKSLNCKNQLWTHSVHRCTPCTDKNHTPIFIHHSLVKRENTHLMHLGRISIRVWPPILYRKSDYSLQPASSSSLRLKWQEQKRLYFFTVLWPLQWLSMCLLPPHLDWMWDCETSRELQSGCQFVFHLSSPISMK